MGLLPLKREVTMTFGTNSISVAPSVMALLRCTKEVLRLIITVKGDRGLREVILMVECPRTLPSEGQLLRMPAFIAEIVPTLCTRLHTAWCSSNLIILLLLRDAMLLWFKRRLFLRKKIRPRKKEKAAIGNHRVHKTKGTKNEATLYPSWQRLARTWRLRGLAKKAKRPSGRNLKKARTRTSPAVP